MDTEPGSRNALDGKAYADTLPFTVEAQGQNLQFIPSGRDRIDALIELIGSARKSIAMCFYIFAEDEAGQRVRDALVEAAERSVDVHLIIDGFGAEAGDKFFKRLVSAGGRYDIFSAQWGLRYLIRNHQKIVIIDNAKAMIGGFNVEQSYFDPPEKNGWHDLGLVIEGDAVEQLSRWFAELEDWAARPNAQLRAIRKKVRGWNAGNGQVRLLIGGPTERLSSWASCVGHDIAKGQRLDMIMAYFSPSARLTRLIGELAARGEARLIMAGKSDNAATLGATRSLYHYLLKHRAEIYEFKPCKLHMKLIVVDDAVYIGSANFDMRSLFINLELMLRIEDKGLAERMREFVEQHVIASEQITLQTHKQDATLWNRIRWNLSWFLVSVLDYTVSRRLNLGL